ncbi:MAG: hypothetical protein OSJ73_26890 [Lachnospiraceae bacterium]|nr:hypothetical protein [Lachnospiraceae bacterium]
MFGPHAAGSIIVHTIHAGRFLFDCTVSLTAVCGQQKESAVMVFILSKLKCFFRLLQSAALHHTEQDMCSYNDDLSDRPEELYLSLLEYFEPEEEEF